jgi:hypothetical protein
LQQSDKECTAPLEYKRPLIFGKATKPRQFKNMEVMKLVSNWKSNKKAWMTSHIMVELLTAFNSKTKQQKRHVLLFLANETCHPRSELSNARLEWVFPNTTSVFQLTDKGVIKCATLKYRTLLMRSLLPNSEAASLPSPSQR